MRQGNSIHAQNEDVLMVLFKAGVRGAMRGTAESPCGSAHFTLVAERDKLGWTKRKKGFVFGPFLLRLLTKTVCSTVCSREWCSVVMIVGLGDPRGGG